MDGCITVPQTENDRHVSIPPHCLHTYTHSNTETLDSSVEWGLRASGFSGTDTIPLSSTCRAGLLFSSDVVFRLSLLDYLLLAFQFCTLISAKSYQSLLFPNPSVMVFGFWILFKTFKILMPATCRLKTCKLHNPVCCWRKSSVSHLKITVHFSAWLSLQTRPSAKLLNKRPQPAIWWTGQAKL